MNEDDSKTAVLEGSLVREIVTGEPPPEGASRLVRINPERRPDRRDRDEGADG